MSLTERVLYQRFHCICSMWPNSIMQLAQAYATLFPYSHTTLYILASFPGPVPSFSMLHAEKCHLFSYIR